MSGSSALQLIPADLLAELQSRYAEPQRAYHTWRHIAELITFWDERQSKLGRPRAVLAAILFHDAIYAPFAKDNEARSADLLTASAAGWLSPEDLAFARTCILATTAHQLPADLEPALSGDLAQFLDMDLAILGAARERFDEYEVEVRREYAAAPEPAYRAGRRQVLERFLARDQLYLSTWGQERFEAPARSNLERSIAALDSQA
jgi:predicted metal-dependent HD superfamily phosphohydrolase